MVLPPVAFVLFDWCVNTDAEANLEHSTIWTAGLYLMLLLQFLENKVAVELTRSEFVEALEVIAQTCSFLTSICFHLVLCTVDNICLTLHWPDICSVHITEFGVGKCV